MRHGGLPFATLLATSQLCIQTGRAQTPDNGAGNFDYSTCLGFTTTTTTDPLLPTTTTPYEFNQFYNGSDDCVGFWYLVVSAAVLVCSFQLAMTGSASYWCYTESKRLEKGQMEPYFGFWSVLCCLCCTVWVGLCPIDQGCDPPIPPDDHLVGKPVHLKKHKPYRNPNRTTVETFTLTAADLWHEERSRDAPLDTNCRQCQKAWIKAEWSPHHKTVTVAWPEDAPPKEAEGVKKDDATPKLHFNAAVASEKRRYIGSMGRLQNPP